LGLPATVGWQALFLPSSLFKIVHDNGSKHHYLQLKLILLWVSEQHL
jgi:hypothetical protein